MNNLEKWIIVNAKTAKICERSWTEQNAMRVCLIYNEHEIKNNRDPIYFYTKENQ